LRKRGDGGFLLNAQRRYIRPAAGGKRTENAGLGGCL